MDGLPVIVGKLLTNGAVDTYQDGFRVVGGDSKGKCIRSSELANADFMSHMGDPTLRFNVDLSYGCTLDFTYQELKSKCSSVQAPLANLEIFNNL